MVKIISYLFHPIFMPFLGLLLVLNLDTYLRVAVQPQVKYYLYGVLIVNTIIFPLLVVLFLKLRKAIPNFQLPSQQDRIIPLGVTSIFFLFTFHLVQKIPLPPVLNSIFLGMTASMILCFLINFFSKLSLHSAGISGVIGILVALYLKFYAQFQFEIIVLILVWGLIGYARLSNRAHKPSQIYLGSAVGFTAVFLPTLFGITI